MEDRATIPMVDLKVARTELRLEIEQGFKEVLDTGQFVLGPNVEAFEREAAAYLGCRRAIACGSGTDALRLALVTAGVGPGDEVITTPFSFFATAEAICQTGALPIFVDIDANTFNLNPHRIEAAISERTRALVPVHLFGQPADLYTLNDIAQQRGLLIVEDCAQSFGARRGQRKAGTFGLAGCFSFFPSKNLGAYGDGGLICTDSEALAEEIRALRNHGGLQRHHHGAIGCNSRLDELQAVVLRAKLRRIEHYNAERRRVAHSYNRHLGSLPGIKTPCEDIGGYHVYHQYTILTGQRDALAASLRRARIDCAIHYPIPIHRQAVFQQSCGRLCLPVAENVARRCLSLPIYPELSEEQIQRVAAVIRQAVLG